MTESQTTSASCHSCGAAQGSEERFCAECGAAAGDSRGVVSDPQTLKTIGQQQTVVVLAEREESDLPAPLPSTSEPVEMTSDLVQGRPRKLPWRLIVKALAAASVLAAVAVLALNDYGTHQRLTRSVGAYTTSQSKLLGTRVQLADTVTRLTGVQNNLASTESSLTTTKQALAAKVQDLAGVRNNLTDVKSNLTIKSGQIETLKSCLNGVSIALRDYANGDYAGTISALNAVQVSCHSAYALL